jgi:hypothetical protein
VRCHGTIKKSDVGHFDRELQEASVSSEQEHGQNSRGRQGWAGGQLHVSGNEVVPSVHPVRQHDLQVKRDEIGTRARRLNQQQDCKNRRTCCTNPTADGSVIYQDARIGGMAIYPNPSEVIAEYCSARLASMSAIYLRWSPAFRDTNGTAHSFAKMLRLTASHPAEPA